MIVLYHTNHEYSISLEYLKKYINIVHPHITTETMSSSPINDIDITPEDTICYNSLPTDEQGMEWINGRTNAIHHLDLFPQLHSQIEYMDLTATDLVYMHRMLNCKDDQTRALAKKTMHMVPIDYFAFFYSREIQVNVQGTYMFNFSHQIIHRELLKRGKYYTTTPDSERRELMLEMFPNRASVVREALEKIGGTVNNK